MDRFQGYLTVYLVGLPVFIISLFWPFLQTPYLIMYFVLSIGFLFSDELIPEDPEHSTVEHFERASRWNIFNYGISAGLAVAAVFVGLVPLPPHISTFVVWSASVIGLYYFVRYYGARALTDLVTDYISEQMPELEIEKLHNIVKSILNGPPKSAGKVASDFKVSEEQAKNILLYADKYMQNNFYVGEADNDESVPAGNS